MNPNSLSANHRIVLVGFSGAGKSTVAKKLASLLNFKVLDTDKMLEEKYRITVYDIFEKYGEDVFRKLEYNTLIEALQQEGVVIATGGGAPCFLDAMELINASSYSVYIELSQKSLTQRLLHAKVTRPLTKNKTEAELFTFVTEQFALRAPYYQQAHITVKGEDLDVNEWVEFMKHILTSSMRTPTSQD
jgi:shikimate kinase